MTEGFLCLLLHAHLPFVRHPEKEGELAEEWLYEAITETYIPLLRVMNKLLKEGVDFHLTLNISPSLVSMLGDTLLQRRYKKHLLKLIELSEKEINRTKNRPDLNQVARLYNDMFKKTYKIFHEKYNDNLIQGFKDVYNTGKLELITSAATHGYLPLLLTEEALSAQVKVGVETFRHYFSQDPAGIWLPECGFKDGIDSILAENDIRYFVSSSHGLLNAVPRPKYGLYAPIYTPNGVAVFGRDRESSKQVWSANEGYPGDFNYREFYRDIGYDLDYNYVKPYLPEGIRKHTGIKYYKITGKTDHKEVYDPDKAREKVAEHAENFIFNRKHQMLYLKQILDRKPIIVAPYDAELFGHWWFEGPLWIEYLFKKIDCDQDKIRTITPSEYLNKYKKNQVAVPSESSWGYKGYHEVWLNGSNDWIYRHLHEAELKIKDLADQNKDLEDKKSLAYRTLNQMARELLLAESSDWAFIIKTDTMVEYALKRTQKHLANFFKLSHQLNKIIDQNFLEKLESKNNIFPFIDFKLYESRDNQMLLRKEG
jgi:1,4-alpha-glucan branching enzyme